MLPHSAAHTPPPSGGAFTVHSVFTSCHSSYRKFLHQCTTRTRWNRRFLLVNFVFAIQIICRRFLGEYFFQSCTFSSLLRILMLPCNIFNEHNKGSKLQGIVTWSVFGKTKSTRAKNVNYRREVILFNSNFTSDAAVYSLNYILSQIEEDATDIF